MTFPTPVALSSAEAEYNNSCAAAVAATAMGMLLQDIRGLVTDVPLRIPLLLDNKACISMGESFSDRKHNRHIIRRYHYVRYMVKDDRIVLYWVPADVQLADPVTKCLNASSPTYVLFRAMAETIVQP
jgi:hypothetical protein